MQEDERNNTLTNRAISKLLDFGSIPDEQQGKGQQEVNPSISELLNRADISKDATNEVPLQASWSSRGKTTSNKEMPTIGGKVFVIVAWIILVLIVGAVLGKLGFKLEFPPSVETVQRNGSYLFHISLLALAGCVLSLTTWLYWKNKLSKTANIAVITVIILSGSLPLWTIGANNQNAGMKRISRALFHSSNTTTPMGERVTGILFSNDRPSAIIGYRIVHEGETIHDVQVVKIHKDKVEFEKDGRRWTQTIQGAPTIYWE